MLRNLCSAAIALFVTTTACGQMALGIDSLLRANSKAVVRNSTTEFVYHSPTSGTERNTRVTTILNSQGRECGDFACYTDNTHQLNSFSGELLDAFGQVIRKFKRSDLKYTEYSNSSLASEGGVYYLEAHAPVSPYTVKYEWEIAYKNGMLKFPTFVPIPGKEISLEHAEYRISVPAGLKFGYLCLNSAAEPEQSTAGGRDIYLWRLDRLPAIKPQQWSPPLDELVPIVEASPREFSYADTRGSLADWAGFGVWQWSLFQGRDVLPEALKAEVHRRTDALTAPRDKVRALYDYLGETTRYVSIQLGIGGWQPMKTEDVYKTKFGDCKALTNYLRAMLRECGIDSHYTIINTRSPRMHRNYPSFTQANHVILRVPLADETLWLECTNTEVPFGYLHDGIAGHDAVIIRDGTAEFTTLPQYADTLNRRIQHVDATLAPDGSAAGHIKERYEVAQYEDMMYFPKKEAKKQIDYLLTDLRKIPMIRLDSVTWQEEKTALPAIEIAYAFNAPKYGNVSGSRCFLPQIPFTGLSKAEKGERLYDIHREAGYSDQVVVTLHIPEDMEIEAMPKPVQMETPFGSFSAEIAFEPGLITIDHRLTIRAGRYPRDTYEEFRSFIDQRAKTFNANLVLKKRQ